MRKLGGSSRTIRATGRIIKSGAERKSVRMMIHFGGVKHLLLPYLFNGVGGVFG